MAHRKFSGETEREMCSEYLAGATVAELAEKHDTQRVTVSRTLERNGIARRVNQGRAARVLTDAQKADVVAAYEAGQRVRDLAGVYGVHYSRVSRLLEDAGVRLRPRSWKGGRTVTSMGYIQVRAECEIGWAMASLHGYVMEHRLVMAQSLGRPLERRESVHHVNGDKTDNRLENLQLRSGHHGSGAALVCRNCGSHDIVPAEIAGD